MSTSIIQKNDHPSYFTDAIASELTTNLLDITALKTTCMADDATAS